MQEKLELHELAKGPAHGAQDRQVQHDLGNHDRADDQYRADEQQGECHHFQPAPFRAAQ